MLERFTEGHHCMCMGALWMLTATLPPLYTHSEKEHTISTSPSGTKNPLLTSYQYLMKLVSIYRILHRFSLYPLWYWKQSFKLFETSLGIHSKTSYPTIYGEFKRFPLSVIRTVQIIRYWYKIKRNPSSLMYKCMQCSAQLLKSRGQGPIGNKKWEPCWIYVGHEIFSKLKWIQ